MDRTPASATAFTLQQRVNAAAHASGRPVVDAGRGQPNWTAVAPRAGFFRPDGKAPMMRRNLLNMIHRLALSEQDIRSLRGAVVRLVRGQRRRSDEAG